MAVPLISDTERHVIRSPFADAQIPHIPVGAWMLRDAARYGAKPAMIDGSTGESFSYTRMLSSVNRVAAGLHQMGARKGEVVAIFSSNRPEFAIAFLAVVSIGAVVTTANPLSTPPELANQLRDARVTLIFTAPELLAVAREAAAIAGVAHVVVFGDSGVATPFSALLEHTTDPPSVSIDPRQDLAVLPYSSGTTGLPKGVMLTHYNLVAHDCVIEGDEVIEADDVLIAVLPFWHIYGMSILMNAALSRGATIVTMPRFDMESFLQLIQDYRVTRAFLVPPIVLGLAKHPSVDNYDLTSLGTIFCGAAPLDAVLSRACADRLNCAVVQGYGMTETSPVTHLTPKGRAKDGSIGVCARSTEALIVDPDTLQPVARGVTGELWVRGPQVMLGYLNNPAATSATLVDGGWIRTGDIAYADDDGYFYIVDRLKELIKYNAYSIAPAELEAHLLSHPAVADAAVIGHPDEAAGELPKAFVVLRSDVTAEELMGYVSQRVAPQKRIRLVEFIDQIPKSASGKILRRVLVERERAAALQSSQPPD
ncbi:MAG TPA: AMP-binding protein [Thermomicrobiales bacterium]|nr:AMP-binding protein [Thermomicrobiales bacterium]